MLWIVPLVTRSVAQATLIPLAVPVMLLTIAFCCAAPWWITAQPKPVAFCRPPLKIASQEPEQRPPPF
jgi:hypothetical protein